MWRYLVGGVAALLLAGAGLMLFRGKAAPEHLLPAMTAAANAQASLPEEVPEATAKTREQKRFNRYDKDKDGKITREEWSAKSIAKFAAADADHNGAMTAVEFATTAVKRKPRAACNCKSAVPAPQPKAEDDEG
jgi:hypothetical protein